MLANRKPLVIFFDTLFHGIRKAIPDYRAKAARKDIAADEPVGSPIAIVKRMNIGEQKMEHRHPYKRGDGLISKDHQCLIHQFNDL